MGKRGGGGGEDVRSAAVDGAAYPHRVGHGRRRAVNTVRTGWSIRRQRLALLCLQPARCVDENARLGMLQLELGGQDAPQTRPEREGHALPVGGGPSCTSQQAEGYDRVARERSACRVKGCRVRHVNICSVQLGLRVSLSTHFTAQDGRPSSAVPLITVESEQTGNWKKWNGKQGLRAG